MNEPGWYCFDTSDGQATICDSKAEAEDIADACNDRFGTGNYRAVQLVDAAELEKANLLIEQQAKRIAELERERRVEQ